MVITLGRVGYVDTELVEWSTIYEGAVCGQGTNIALRNCRHERVAGIGSPLSEKGDKLIVGIVTTKVDDHTSL